MKPRVLDIDLLRATISYDATTGLSTWRISRGNVSAGSVCGGTSAFYGYRVIGLYGTIFKHARVAWAYETGEWPVDFIDHINGITDDDRFANLRLATHSQNMANRKLNRDNSLGMKGVRSKGTRFEARIKGRSIGLFDSPSDAQTAYLSAARALYGAFARTT